MDKQLLNCQRSRAKMEIHTHGGRVTGWHPKLPVIYAVPPCSGPLWPVIEVTEKVKSVVNTIHISNIDGCIVIWGGKYPDIHHSVTNKTNQSFNGDIKNVN